MQGKNFIAAVHLRKTRLLVNANDFVAFGGCKSFSPAKFICYASLTYRGT